MSKLKRATLAGAVLGAAALAGISSGSPLARAADGPDPAGATTTPIKHLVVIFQENVSFDHYFATYPNAANTDGQRFEAAPGTPTVNGLRGGLLTSNPNASNPQRLTNSQAATCDQGHGYTAEQKAFDNGLMDQFVPNTGRGLTLQQCPPTTAIPRAWRVEREPTPATPSWTTTTETPSPPSGTTPSTTR